MLTIRDYLSPTKLNFTDQQNTILFLTHVCNKLQSVSSEYVYYLTKISTFIKEIIKNARVVLCYRSAKAKNTVCTSTAVLSCIWECRCPLQYYQSLNSLHPPNSLLQSVCAISFLLMWELCWRSVSFLFCCICVTFTCFRSSNKC